MQTYRQPGHDTAVLALDGEIDVFTRESLRAEVQDLIEVGVRRLVINMHRVRFINTSGIGALLEIHRQLERLEGQLIVSQPSEAAWQPIELLGLDRVLTVRHRRFGRPDARPPLAPGWSCDATIAKAG